ncbi:MAG: CAP domain-containing protein [Anaerolineales bacterium]|nr:CAP domain-containing protein [Anaerolineales bacterium]
MLWRIGLATLAAGLGAGCAPHPLTPAPTLLPPVVALATQTPAPTETPEPSATPTAAPTVRLEPSATVLPPTPAQTVASAVRPAGGAGSAVSFSMTVQPSPVAPPVSVVTSPPETAIAAPPSADVAAAELYMVELVNARRQTAGLAPLIADPTLMSVARARAADMVARNYTGHYDPVTGASLARPAMRAAGFTSSYLGENWYGSGRALPEAVDAAMSWFMGDAPHRDNILNPNYVFLGVGLAHNGRLWLIVQNFAGAN